MGRVLKVISPIVLDVTSTVNNDRLIFKKGESGSRYFTFYITEQGKAFDLTDLLLEFEVVKVDKTVVSSLVSVLDATKGIAEAQILSQMVSCTGDCLCNLRILDGSAHDVFTQSFVYSVVDNKMSDDIIISSSEFSIFSQAISLCNKTKFYKWSTKITRLAGMQDIVIPSGFVVSNEDLLKIMCDTYAEELILGNTYDSVEGQVIKGVFVDDVNTVFTITNFGS